MIRQVLGIHCPQCHYNWPEGTLYCDECGAALSPWLTLRSEAAAPSPDVLAGAGWVADHLELYESPTDPSFDRLDSEGNLAGVSSVPADQDEYDGFGEWADSAFEQPRQDSQFGNSYQAPRLILLRLPDGQLFELQGKPQYLIGRRDPANKVLPEVDLTDWNGAAAGVSRTHASIYMTPIGVYVEDLESRNETIHNGYRLLPRQRYRLDDGDELRLG